MPPRQKNKEKATKEPPPDGPGGTTSTRRNTRSMKSAEKPVEAVQEKAKGELSAATRPHQPSH